MDLKTVLIAIAASYFLVFLFLFQNVWANSPHPGMEAANITRTSVLVLCWFLPIVLTVWQILHSSLLGLIGIWLLGVTARGMSSPLFFQTPPANASDKLVQTYQPPPSDAPERLIELSSKFLGGYYWISTLVNIAIVLFYAI